MSSNKQDSRSKSDLMVLRPILTLCETRNHYLHTPCLWPF